MTRYTWTSTGTHTRTVCADRVTFEPAHVAFWKGNARDGYELVLAVRNDVVRDLHPEESTE